MYRAIRKDGSIFINFFWTQIVADTEREAPVIVSLVTTQTAWGPSNKIFDGALRLRNDSLKLTSLKKFKCTGHRRGPPSPPGPISPILSFSHLKNSIF